MFCDIRIHEQIKRMNAIQQELDHFQITCEEIIQSTLQSNTENEISTELLRADQFLQSTMKIQSELIGHALLEVVLLWLICNRLKRMIQQDFIVRLLHWKNNSLHKSITLYSIHIIINRITREENTLERIIPRKERSVSW